MIIAQEKKQQNIVEYILYMYQIEDIIRANQFQITSIQETVINQFAINATLKEEMSVWYQDLIDKMYQQNITRSGHLDFINKLTESLNELHQSLLHDPDQLPYIKQYQLAKPNIIAYKEKSKLQEASDITTCLHGVYGLLLLRLKQTDITLQTEQALGSFRLLLALLSPVYHKQQKDANE